MVSEGIGAVSKLKKPCPELEIDASHRPGLSSASLGLRPAMLATDQCAGAYLPFGLARFLLPRLLKGLSASAQREMEARSLPAKKDAETTSGMWKARGTQPGSPSDNQAANRVAASRNMRQGRRLTMWKGNAGHTLPANQSQLDGLSTW